MKNSFLIAFISVIRNFKNNIISILGMCMAFLVGLLILIYVNDQLRVDKSQSHYDNIYRMEKDDWAMMAGGVIPWVAEQFPEVKAYTRFGGTYWESVVDYNNDFHTINKVLFIDGQPFDVFDYDFKYGNANTALDAPNSVILTANIADRIFKGENPMGKMLNYNGKFPLIVSAVIEERNDLHLQFDMLIQFQMLKDICYRGNDEFMTRLNGSQNFLSYMVLSTENPEELSDKINAKLVEIEAYNADNDPPNYLFRPFSDIYFNNDAIAEIGIKHGNRPTVIAMIFVALFILLIATINYINTTTARGITRAREVGLKKLFGSDRTSLILQFIYESTVISLLSMGLAILLLLISYNGFQTMLGIILPPLNELSATIYLTGLVMLIFVSLAGGIYPALYLSSLKPGSLFNTNLRSGGKGIKVRRALLLIQFVIAIFLSIQSMAIFRQYVFMINKDLGMDKDQIILFELPAYLSDRSGPIREALLEHKDIDGVSFGLQALGDIRNTNTLVSPINETQVSFKIQLTDPEYFTVLGLDFLSGRKFTRDREADKRDSWIINETGARAIGFNQPETITGLRWAPYGDTKEINIIGVVKDYHFNAVNKGIEPTIVRWVDGFNMGQLRFSSENVVDVLNHIEDVWKQFEQQRPLNYSFLDDTFDKHYETEQRLSTLIGLFTLIAVIIGSFGVFGISAFMAKQMSKSIALRRVMGGDTRSLVKKFSSEYFWIVIIAALIAIPLAYLYINNWLSRFPYKADIQVWIFIIAVLFNLIIALATAAYHALKTANLNPAEVLRHE